MKFAMRAGGSRLGLLGILALTGLPAPAGAQPVGAEFQVNTYTTGNQETSKSAFRTRRLIAADASGNFVVVWESDDQDGSFDGIFGQRYDSAGGVQGSEFRVNSYTTSSQSNPSVASDASGNFVVVWSSFGQDGDGTGIFGQRYDSAGAALGSEFRVNTYTRDEQERPSATSDASGNFVVVWDSYLYGDYNEVYGQRYDRAGHALGAEFRVNSDTIGFQSHPSVASDASGNFVVVWSFSPGPQLGGDIYGQRYDSEGVPQGEHFRISGGSVGSVASDASGNFVVVWDVGAVYTGGEEIYGQRYDSGGFPQGGQFHVNSYRVGYQQGPSVASDASGNFVVAWSSRDQDGSYFGIFGQRYDSGGEPRGTEFRINSYTTSDQQSASVGFTGTNQFVVAWTSYNQDGDGAAVFGQRFDFGGGGTITVVSPNTNVKWRIGSLQTIKWTHNLGRGETFRIQLDRDDDGEYEELIGAEAPADADTRGHFGWTVTGPLSPAARVRVSWTTNPDVSDTSDVTFQIRPVPLGATQGPRER